jgi:hypothetical protein
MACSRLKFTVLLISKWLLFYDTQNDYCITSEGLPSFTIKEGFAYLAQIVKVFVK